MKIINSKLITDAVYNLCKQANIYITKDVYKKFLEAKNNEKAKSSKVVLEQILNNIKIATQKQRPLCQDTGMVIVFADIGKDIHIEGDLLEDAINKGVKESYLDNCMRKSTVTSPTERKNSNDNTPAIIHTEIVEGNTINLSVMIKGAGSENMSSVKMLSPSAGIDGIMDFIINTVKQAGSNPCPPIRLGVGIGGNLEKSAILSKKALLHKVEIFSEFESKLINKINKLNIGPMGLGGNFSCYGVNILEYPTHIASLPVAVTINCHSSRHSRCEIFENQINYHLEDFQMTFEDIKEDYSDYVKIKTSEIDKIKNLKKDDKILLSGEIFTARDKTHQMLIEDIKNSTPPFDIKDKIMFYAGPCPVKGDEIIGPIGPTTSKRMDKYAKFLYDAGILATIGKGDRDIYNGIYFTTTGGVASLLADNIKEAVIVAYKELGAEAVFKLKVKDFPVICKYNNYK